MQYEVEVNGHFRKVTVNRHASHFVVSVGDRQWTVDAAQVGSHVLSLLIQRNLPRTHASTAADPPRPGVLTSCGQDGACSVDSREITIASDPVTGQSVLGIGTLPLLVGLNTRRRWGRVDDGGQRGSGPQRIVAPMPGKVVRVLAIAGESVIHRQPVVVIEAMKMENELRALRDGTVTEVLVQEGQSVEAGMLLAIITPS